METQKTISFVTLMGISLLRKKILQYIGSFDDLENLSKTCRWMNYYVQIESIKRGVYFYNDYNRIYISAKERISNGLNPYKLEELEITNDSNFYVRLDFLEKCTNEFISYHNLTTFDYDKDAIEIDNNDIENIKKKFSEEINLILSCVIRKDAKILEFSNDLRKKSFLILYLMRHMNHENIKRIKIPDTFVSCYMNKCNKEFNYGIFNGLPKFNELLINIDYNYNEGPNYDRIYNRFMNSMNFLENILDGLSKKKNGTLILEDLNGDYNKIVRFIKMIYEVTQKYNVKLKCNCNCYFNKSKRKKRTTISLEKYSFPSVRSHIASIYSLRITFSLYYIIFNSLKHFENLENLYLLLTNFDIKKVFEKRTELNDNSLSLTSCKKLKYVEIFFEPIRKTNYEKNLEVLYDNTKIIASMMPKTVEILKLTRMDYLTKEVTEAIDEFMPNIKLFVTQNVSFKDLDCLSSFKHLQAFIYNQNYPIHIPGTVKFVGICNHYIHNDGRLEIITFDQELINTYSKRFSKQLSSEFGGGCFFFNDIRQWSMYKRIISNQFTEMISPF